MISAAKKFFAWLGSIQIPFFKHVPLGLVTRILWKQINSNEMSMKASAIAFNFFMALFPATIFFFTMLAFVPYSGFEIRFMELLRFALPESAFLTVKDTIEDILRNQISNKHDNFDEQELNAELNELLMEETKNLKLIELDSKKRKDSSFNMNDLLNSLPTVPQVPQKSNRNT
jgi:hypothetical protein